MPTISKGIDVKDLNPVFAGNLWGLINEVESKGGKVVINSGHRSIDEQTQLYNNRGNNPNPVARPGTSLHEKGYAADLGGNAKTMQMLHDLAAKYGITGIAGDPVHFQLASVQSPQGQPGLEPKSPAAAQPSGPMPLQDRLAALAAFMNPSMSAVNTDSSSPTAQGIGATATTQSDTSTALSTAPTMDAGSGDVSTPTTPTSDAPVGGGQANESQFASLFNQAGQKYGVDPRLLQEVARAESGFNPQATSGVGAQGLMQIMPGTAHSLGVDPHDPAQAVDGAARLLAGYLKQFGSVDLALAAYNAGPGAVAKAGNKVPNYAETQKYVRDIKARLGQ